MNYNSGTPYASHTRDSCVAILNCAAGYYANIGTYVCEPCSPQYATVAKTSCVSSPTYCGNGNSVLANYQCINCLATDSSKSYANVAHTNCVAMANCDDNYYGNPSTRTCEPCVNSGYFVSVDHSTCYATKPECGSGNAVVAAVAVYQCRRCQVHNSGLPYALPGFDGCVAQVNCPNNYWGNSAS